MNIRQILSSLMIPSGLILLVSIGLWHWTPRPELLSTFLPVWPYVVLSLGVALGWRFQRSRLLLTLLVLTLGQPQVVAILVPSFTPFALAAISIVLPVNLLWLAFSPQRHLLSVTNLVRLLFIAGQGALIWLAHYYYAEQSWAILTLNPLQGPVFDLVLQPVFASILPLSMCAFIVTFLCFILGLCWRPTMERGAQVMMLLSVVLSQRSTGDEALFYSASAALVLIVALLESSHSMAFRDDLTGLLSRRAPNEYLQCLSGCYTLAMVDIDHFKRVNDTHGHDIGDQVLKMVASCLAKVKGGGKAFRYGGEEFTVVFSGKSCDEVLPHLEVLRMTIENSVFSLRSKPRPKNKPKKVTRQQGTSPTLRVTVSMGVAEHSERKQSAEHVVKQADTALYRAKKSGRNKVC